MADVWKSQGRKFCEICKVWFGDNRASIEFHERGKKHKDNLAAKLRELGKKSREQEKMQAKMSSALAAMEAAALKAMRDNGEGIQHGPALPATGLTSKIFDPRLFKDVGAMARELGRRKNEAQELKRTAPPPIPSAPTKYYRREVSVKVEYPELSIPVMKEQVEATTSSPDKVWVEADAGDGSGSKYYFHMYTGESKWEQPDSFYTVEEYQKYLTSIEQCSVKPELQSPGEGEPATSKIVDDARTETEPSVKCEDLDTSSGFHVDLGNIPLPSVGTSEAESIVTVKEEPPSGHVEDASVTQSEDHSGSAEAAHTSQEAIEASDVINDNEGEVEKTPVGPFGSWTRVKEVNKKPVFSPLTAKFRAEEERQRKKEEEREKTEPKVEFTEKTSAVLTKKVKGPIEFKKRTATKNVRQRAQ